MELQEHRVIEGALYFLHTIRIQIKLHIFEPDLTSALNRQLWVEQGRWIDEGRRLSFYLHFHEDRSVVTTEKVFMTPILGTVSIAV